MDSQIIINDIISVQVALNVIAVTLQLTGYLFPMQSNVEDGFTFDYIVVGGGTAGSIVASRLSEERDIKVLLIEAGGDAPLQVMTPALFAYHPNSPLDWNYTTQNDEYTFRCHKKHVLGLTSGRVLGGGSSVNYMLYARGNRVDYQRWADIAKDDTWIWENVLPYFKKSERLEDPVILNSSDAIYHGTLGYVGITRENNKQNLKYLESFKELGNKIVLDLSGANVLGYTEPLFTFANGKRQNTGYCFLSPTINRSNFYILKNTVATKIIFNKDKRATGVKVMTQDNETLTFNTKKEIIISAGVFNTPKLLMLSGIGPAEHLRILNIDIIADLPVGKNLQDHVVIPISHQVKRNNTTPKPSDPNVFPCSAVLGLTALNISQTYPDYELQFYILAPGSILPAQIFAFDYKYDFSVAQKLYDITNGTNSAVALVTALHPKSRGEVLLRSANPRDHPLVYTGYFSNKKDLENIIKYVEDYVKIINTSYFKESGANYVDLAFEKCSGFEIGSKEYWRCYILCMMNSAFDFSGTCSIGTVVDSRLRVISVKGLRVVDASVIPVIPSSAINAPVMMIAEKASDMIKEDNYR